MPISQDIEIIPKKADGTPLLGKIASVRTLNPDVATATMLDDDTARVTRVGLGETSLIATVDGIDSAPIPITVRREVALLTLSLAPRYGAIGETFQLTWTAQDPGGVPIDNVTPVFVSSHPAFATVDEHGLVTFVADSGATEVTITATADAQVRTASFFVAQSIRALILANGGVEWVPGLGDRQSATTEGPGITEIELENGSQANGPVCFLDVNGVPRIVGDGARAKRPPNVQGAFHFHSITAVGVDTVPIPGVEPDSFGRIFEITDTLKLTVSATNEGETAWRGGGTEFQFVPGEENQKTGGRRWVQGIIYVRAPRPQDEGREVQIVLTMGGQTIERRTITLTAEPTLYRLFGWREGDTTWVGTVHFIFPPTQAAPGQISVYGPSYFFAEMDVPEDAIVPTKRWSAETSDGVNTPAYEVARAFPMGQLGVFVGDAAYQAAGESWNVGGAIWISDIGPAVTKAIGTVRNPDKGYHEPATSIFTDLTIPNTTLLRMSDAFQVPFNGLNGTDTQFLKGVGMLCVAWIAAGPNGALPADGALEAMCRAKNGDGGDKTGPMKRYRRIPGTNIWEYRGLTAPFPITSTSTSFVGGIRNVSGGTLRFEIGPVALANPAANGARDEAGIWPFDYWPYWTGNAADVAKQHIKMQKPSIWPQVALLSPDAGVYINRFAVPYNPATDLKIPDATYQLIVKQISDGGVPASFGNTLNSQFKGGRADGSDVPRFNMHLEPVAGSGNTSAGVTVPLTGDDAALFAETFQHHDIVMRWNGRAVVDWAIDPVDLTTVASGKGWRTDSIDGPANPGWDYTEFGTWPWCPWDDRDFRMGLQGWGYGICVLKGVMPSRAACMAILEAWGPRQKIDFATGLKVAA